MKLHTHLRRLRENAGLLQRDIAHSLGVSVALISRWEHGNRTPRIGALIALARLYGLTLDELVNDDTITRARHILTGEQIDADTIDYARSFDGGGNADRDSR